MIYHPNWDTWRVKRSAINNYAGTTDINWAVLGKVGCAVKKTRVGDRPDTSTTLCDPMLLTIYSTCSILLHRPESPNLSWFCFLNRNGYGVH